LDMTRDSKRQVLQCVAVCCSVLQCVAVCCSVLQCDAVHSSTLQSVAAGSIIRVSENMKDSNM